MDESDQEPDPLPLFKWATANNGRAKKKKKPVAAAHNEGDAMVRSSDGIAAHKAAARAKRGQGKDRKIAFSLWNKMIQEGFPGTLKFFGNEYLPSQGFTKTRTKTLRRRISDLKRFLKNPERIPEILQLLEETDRLYDDRSTVLIYTPKGLAVLKDPSLMSDEDWNTKIEKRAKRRDSD